jgi:hypothetical protein
MDAIIKFVGGSGKVIKRGKVTGHDSVITAVQDSLMHYFEQFACVDGGMLCESSAVGESGIVRVEIEFGELRKCPRCKKMHRWPTDDKLCYKCEGAWVKMFK